MPSLGDARVSAPVIDTSEAAVARWRAMVEQAEIEGDRPGLSRALRHLAVALAKRDDHAAARALCGRSYAAARRARSDVLAAKALNTLGGLELTSGALDRAERCFHRALELGGVSGDLRARVEQNLGILANIRGALDEARTRYERSLAAYHEDGNEAGCAIAYHNLGMVNADQGLHDEADHCFRNSHAIAERLGDRYLCGLCLVNRAEVDVQRQRFENARQDAERALELFDAIGAKGPKAEAYRVLGMVYRETGRPVLAESRLRAAIGLAAATGSVLNEAEATRELALLYRAAGRNQDALRQLNVAYRLFQQLDARVDMVDVGGKKAQLEGTYLAVVRDWGRSIEACHPATYGHCERVAEGAVAMAQALGLDAAAQTTILLGAYLHDVGKVRVPHEILAKQGPLTAAERTVLANHPAWGVELLEGLDLPWNIVPIIRWHHERRDGSGYPDGLFGDAIPLAAEIVGLLDCYDDLTGGAARLPPADAVTEILRRREQWSSRVVAAFLRSTVHGRQTVGG